MTSGPEYIAERSVWWEAGIEGSAQETTYLSKQVSIAE